MVSSPVFFSLCLLLRVQHPTGILAPHCFCAYICWNSLCTLKQFLTRTLLYIQLEHTYVWQFQIEIEYYSTLVKKWVCGTSQDLKAFQSDAPVWVLFTAMTSSYAYWSVLTSGHLHRLHTWFCKHTIEIGMIQCSVCLAVWWLKHGSNTSNEGILLSNSEAPLKKKQSTELTLFMVISFGRIWNSRNEFLLLNSLLV